MVSVINRNKARRGVTLIEAVLFISIALGLIVGGLVFFQQASVAARTNDAVRSISSMASETRAAYRTQATFTGLSSAVLIASGAIPSSRISGTDIQSEWNKVVTIAPNSLNLGDQNYTAVAGASVAGSLFTITYNDIPEAACTRLATATTGSGPIGPGIVGVAVRSSTAAAVFVPIGGNTNVSIPGLVNITPADAATTCAAGDEPVDVTWVLAK